MAKTELQHPEGKKAVSMDSDKYNLLADALLNLLEGGKELTHNELLTGVKEGFSRKSISFPGSVNWHLEWVKLDLEAKGKIKRTGKDQVKYLLNKQS